MLTDWKIEMEGVATAKISVAKRGHVAGLFNATIFDFKAF